MRQGLDTTKIKQQLDAGLPSLDARVAARLGHARQAALARYPHAVARRVTGLSLVDGWLERHDWHPSSLSMLTSGLVLLMGLAGAIYWYNLYQPDDDIDAVLLADELPLQAYVDNRFEQWLER